MSRLSQAQEHAWELLPKLLYFAFWLVPSLLLLCHGLGEYLLLPLCPLDALWYHVQLLVIWASASWGDNLGVGVFLKYFQYDVLGVGWPSCIYYYKTCGLSSQYAIHGARFPFVWLILGHDIAHKLSMLIYWSQYTQRPSGTVCFLFPECSMNCLWDLKRFFR
jgi:hypothetical protein